MSPACRSVSALDDGWRTALKCWAIAFCAIPSLCKADPVLQLSAGVDYSTGAYGASSSTDAIIEPLLAKVALGDWTVRALVPFASIRSPSDVVLAVDESGGELVDSVTEEQVEPGPKQRSVWRSGLSDVSLSATHSFDKLAGTPLYIDTTVRVRLPTGNRHLGLGTGATDVFLDNELGADWSRGGMSFDLGRRFLSNVRGLARRDGWQISAGGWFNPTKQTQLGISYDWHTAAVAGVSDYQLIGGYASYRLSRDLKLQLFSGTGLSRSSPSFDVSLTLIYRPFGRPR